jgi:hypothetical protein
LGASGRRRAVLRSGRRWSPAVAVKPAYIMSAVTAAFLETGKNGLRFSRRQIG